MTNAAEFPLDNLEPDELTPDQPDHFVTDFAAAKKRIDAFQPPPPRGDDDFLAEMRAFAAEAAARPCTEKCTGCGTPMWTCCLCSDCEAKQTAIKARERWLSWAPLMLRDASTLDGHEVAVRVKDRGAVARVKAALVTPWRSIVLAGPAGVGKSTLAVAAANVATDSHTRAWSPYFVDALELATARARGRLGEEPESVASAMSRGLLVLDELGRGRPSQWNAIEDVIFDRYNAQKRTIYTTPALSVEELQTRLGDDGLARRVLEGAVVVVMKGGRK